MMSQPDGLEIHGGDDKIAKILKAIGIKIPDCEE